jgi:hypothetical protein
VEHQLAHLTKSGFLASHHGVQGKLWELAQEGRRCFSLLRSPDHLLNKPTPLEPVGTSHSKLVLSLSTARSSRCGDTSTESYILIDHEAVDLTGGQNPAFWVNGYALNGGRIMTNPQLTTI